MTKNEKKAVFLAKTKIYQVRNYLTKKRNEAKTIAEQEEINEQINKLLMAVALLVERK